MSEVDCTDLLGRPFAYGGRGPDAYDCYGLAMEVCRRAGIDLPEWRSVCEPVLIQDGFEAGKEFFEELAGPQPFCIVLLMVRPPYVSHCGVMLDGGRFIHIMERTRVTIERIDGLAWRRRVRGFYRFRG
ncbi:NlpC/P60 family protein [Geobacter sp.]|uniref:C40 family peptidase n=1 Tax=Geobacter sp. TaxID=46610 RepID=UPI0026386386|nr:NlpC/P60 family protein [Geobacter sp.]